MAGIFKFKQFDVDQGNCAMKVNTDGVLLGALASADNPQRILDIGTGTGVIALMLAQRFPGAKIDAVEIDEKAAKTAELNFNNSPFAGRMKVFAMGFEAFFESHPEKRYDLIVSNPPFFLNSLVSPGVKKALAKHTDAVFFERLVGSIAGHLNHQGVCTMVLPLETAKFINKLAQLNELHLPGVINVKSFVDSAPHRQLVTFGNYIRDIQNSEFTIYDDRNVYSLHYRCVLQGFLTIF